MSDELDPFAVPAISEMHNFKYWRIHILAELKRAVEERHCQQTEIDVLKGKVAKLETELEAIEKAEDVKIRNFRVAATVFGTIGSILIWLVTNIGQKLFVP